MRVTICSPLFFIGAIMHDLEWLKELSPSTKVTIQPEIADMLELPTHTTAGRIVEAAFVPKETETMIEIESDLNMEL
jgi:hypothetical protein